MFINHDEFYQKFLKYQIPLTKEKKMIFLSGQIFSLESNVVDDTGSAKSILNKEHCFENNDNFQSRVKYGAHRNIW